MGGPKDRPEPPARTHWTRTSSTGCYYTTERIGPAEPHNPRNAPEPREKNVALDADCKVPFALWEAAGLYWTDVAEAGRPCPLEPPPPLRCQIPTEDPGIIWPIAGSV